MNYFQKYFLIFLYVSMSSVYAMKREWEDTTYQKVPANNVFMKTIKAALDNDFSYETDWQQIKECLEKEKADPNCIIDQFGTTILTLAAIRENKDFVDYLLRRGDVNVNIPDSRGWTPLFFMLQTLKPDNEEESENEEEPEEEEPAIQIIKSLLAHKADLGGPKAWKGTHLSFVARWGYKDLIKPLIECGADINQTDVLGYNPLRWAIEKGNLAIITELCKEGASLFNLDEFGYNAFHLVADLPKEHIKALITHARFDWEMANEARYKQIKTKVLGILWAFKQFGFPKDIQFNILSKLSPSYFYGGRGLCKKLREMGYEHPSNLAQLNNRIEWVKQALQDTKNATGKNPLQYLYNNRGYQYKVEAEVESLLSGSELKNAYVLFDKEFPCMDQSNLICQMYTGQLYK